MSRSDPVLAAVLVTPPAAYPISLAEARTQCRVEHTEDDAILTAYIAAATGLVEDYTQRALITQGFRGVIDAWPATCWTAKLSMELPRAPLRSIDAVTTYAADGTPSTFDPDSYHAVTDTLVGQIAVASGSDWPTPGRDRGGIEIAWTSGYGDNPSDVPEPIRAAIFIVVAEMYEKRTSEAVLLSDAVKALLARYKIISVA